MSPSGRVTEHGFRGETPYSVTRACQLQTQLQSRFLLLALGKILDLEFGLVPE